MPKRPTTTPTDYAAIVDAVRSSTPKTGSPYVLLEADAFPLLDAFSLLVDAVLTDPPYGINWKGHNASTLAWDAIAGDDAAPDLRRLLRFACPVVCFGANNFPEQLPHRGRWIVWDKRVNSRADKMLGSPVELAWANRTSGFDRVYRVQHGGVVNADKFGERRVHPTQKPIRLFECLVADFTKPGDVVFDPFAGSGTTGVAAMRLGRKFVGIELDPRHAATARRRLAKAAEEFPFSPGAV